MNTDTHFSLNRTDILKAMKDMAVGLATVAVTAGSYIVLHPETLGPHTVITTCVLAILPGLISFLGRWVGQSSDPSSPQPGSSPATRQAPSSVPEELR